MIDKNGSNCKYVEIFTHHVGSIGARSRRTVFIRETSFKLWEVPNIASRNMKTNIYQEGCTGLRATIDLNREKVHQTDVSFYAKNVSLISLKQSITVRNTRGKRDRNRRTQTSAECSQASLPRLT
jgi:hypothetical protein